MPGMGRRSCLTRSTEPASSEFTRVERSAVVHASDKVREFFDDYAKATHAVDLEFLGLTYVRLGELLAERLRSG